MASIDIIKDESMVLVIDGVPYSLVKDKTCAPCIVCSKCDLAEICCSEDTNQKLIDLCMANGRSSAWYFVTDWDILTKKIADYIDYGVELQADKL